MIFAKYDKEIAKEVLANSMIPTSEDVKEASYSEKFEIESGYNNLAKNSQFKTFSINLIRKGEVLG